MPVLEASVSTTNVFEKSGKVRTGAEVSSSLSNPKAVDSSGPHVKPSFHSSRAMGRAMMM